MENHKKGTTGGALPPLGTSGALPPLGTSGALPPLGTSGALPRSVEGAAEVIRYNVPEDQADTLHTKLQKDINNPEPGADPLEVRLAEVNASPWFTAWGAAYGDAVGSVLGQPSVTGIIQQMNGLRYQGAGALPGVARQFGDFCGNHISTFNQLKLTLAKCAEFREDFGVLDGEAWVRLIITAAGNLCQRMIAYRQAKRTPFLVKDGEDPKIVELKHRHGMDAIAGQIVHAAIDGMAMCALWYRQAYLRGEIEVPGKVEVGK